MWSRKHGILEYENRGGGFYSIEREEGLLVISAKGGLTRFTILGWARFGAVREGKRGEEAKKKDGRGGTSRERRQKKVGGVSERLGGEGRK